MSAITLVLIVVLTSLGAYLVATRVTGLRGADLHGAVTETLECLGLVVIFILANVAVGTVVILGVRALTGWFLSVYIVNDATLAILSVLQALVFHRWRARSSRHGPGSPPRGQPRGGLAHVDVGAGG